MPLCKNPNPSDKSLTARRANAFKSSGPRGERGKLRPTGRLRPNFRRLPGVTGAVSLDPEPGAAVHFYYDPISRYKKVPPPVATQDAIDRKMRPAPIELKMLDLGRGQQPGQASRGSGSVKRCEKNIHVRKAGISHGINDIGQNRGLHRKPECPLE